MRKKRSSDREKLLKFEAEGREFAKILRSLEQFIQQVKVQTNFCKGGPVEERLQKKTSQYSKFEFSLPLVFVRETTQFLTAKH